MKGMVLAAGLGTRFRPVTDTIPKPLVPLCNQPLAGWVVDSLIAAGADEVVVNLHHHPAKLRAWLDARYKGSCTIRYSDEPVILGTGGGLRKVRRYFEREEIFLLVNGDSVQFPPWNALIGSLRTSGAIAAMLLRHPPRDDRFTSVWVDGHRVTSIGAAGCGEPLMFSGVHALTPDVFECLPDRDVSGMTEDFYRPMLERGEREIVGVVHDGLWFDVGSPRRYSQASRELTAAIARGEVRAPAGSHAGAGASVVADSARIDGTISMAVAGECSVIEGGAIVADSALWEHAVVGANARVEGSIVGNGVHVAAGAVVRNALLWGRDVIPVDPDLPCVVTEL
ncbi:MAG: NDP-sugar synthase [Acidobacteria bacterium]|nr:NDP-sugar synthase [Acidobacteriota bacterium]